MSFYWRLFLGISSAVLITAGAYSTLGYLSFKRKLDVQFKQELEEFSHAAQSSLDISEKRPVLRPNKEAREIFSEYSSSRFQVRHNERVVLEFGGVFPKEGTWQKAKVSLGKGYVLELALDLNEQKEALNAYLRTNALVLPIVLGGILALSLLYQHFLLRPLTKLEKAISQLSHQEIPEPILLPKGNDKLSHLAKSFNRMTISLKTFIERERSFTRYASHELRTPLSNIRVLVEGAERGIFTSEEARSQIYESLERIEGMLSGLLILTRSQKLSPEPVLLEVIINHLIGTLPASERSRTYFDKCSSPIAMGQGELIEQVISNLLHNALKYSQGQVCIALEENIREAIVKVRDYGQGVPEESLSRLAEPFFRLNKRQGGFGLGLALVEHIVCSMQGKLSIVNASPGLEVTIYLPLIKEGFEE